MSTKHFWKDSFIKVKNFSNLFFRQFPRLIDALNGQSHCWDHQCLKPDHLHGDILHHATQRTIREKYWWNLIRIFNRQYCVLLLIPRLFHIQKYKRRHALRPRPDRVHELCPRLSDSSTPVPDSLFQWRHDCVPGVHLNLHSLPLFWVPDPKCLQTQHRKFANQLECDILCNYSSRLQIVPKQLSVCVTFTVPRDVQFWSFFPLRNEKNQQSNLWNNDCMQSSDQLLFDPKHLPSVCIHLPLFPDVPGFWSSPVVYQRVPIQERCKRSVGHPEN